MTSPNQNNESWLHRVLNEMVELEKKVDALRLFLGSDATEKLSSVAQADLREQLYHMDSYLSVLQRRIRGASTN